MLPGGSERKEPIYLIGRDKIYDNPKENQPKLRKIDEEALKADLTYTQNIVISYLLLRTPKTYSVAVRILAELKYKFETFRPKNFIDFGSGLGSAGLAFLDTYDPNLK